MVLDPDPLIHVPEQDVDPVVVRRHFPAVLSVTLQ